MAMNSIAFSNMCCGAIYVCDVYVCVYVCVCVYVWVCVCVCVLGIHMSIVCYIRHGNKSLH